MAEKNKEKKSIVVTVDMGGSQNKVIAQIYPDGYPQTVILDSEIADVSAASLRSISNEGKPESRVWVGIGDEYYVLGTLARHQFKGITQLKELKYELAVPKICGLIWLVKEKLNLGSNFSVYLNVLLPPGEVQDKDQLQLRLKETFKGFDTPAGKIKIKLVNFNAVSEGSGIYFHFKHSRSGIVPTSLFVMMGYRNASTFLVRDGVPGRGVTSDLGMSWLVNSFVSKVSGLNSDDFGVVEAMVASGKDCDPVVLERLSRKRKPAEIKADGEFMCSALVIARDEYWRAIARWLRSCAESDVRELVFCGGTADYIQPEIDAYCEKEGFKVSWHGNINVPTKITMGLGSRMADVYALHQYCVCELDKLIDYKERKDNEFVKQIKHQSSSVTSNSNQKGFLMMADNI
ncbi:MAG: ParM/StbA family protein [Scytonematopsis contorta HA4267-MV1]|jgi:hypothetical protein|nr:ParM/StbA family protein [Scytonematopsis contorta HA4267-MV1]